LSELSEFTQSEPRVFPLPGVEHLLADANVATEVRDRRPALSLPQYSYDLLFGMSSSSSHRRVLLLSEEDHAASHFLKLSLAYFRRLGQE